MISALIPRDFIKRTWSNIKRNQRRNYKDDRLRTFQPHDVEEYRSGLKNQTFPTLLVGLRTRLGRRLPFLVLASRSYQLHIVRHFVHNDLTRKFTHWFMPDKTLRAVIWLAKTHKRILCLRGRSAGSFPEQRLVIEPTWVPTWRLHTKFYKFGWNTFPNNARINYRTDLNLSEVVYISIIFHIPVSWPNLLNGYDFYFWWRDTANQP